MTQAYPPYQPAPSDGPYPYPYPPSGSGAPAGGGGGSQPSYSPIPINPYPSKRRARNTLNILTIRTIRTIRSTPPVPAGLPAADSAGAGTGQSARATAQAAHGTHCSDHRPRRHADGGRRHSRLVVPAARLWEHHRPEYGRARRRLGRRGEADGVLHDQEGRHDRCVSERIVPRRALEGLLRHRSIEQRCDAHRLLPDRRAGE